MDARRRTVLSPWARHAVAWLLAALFSLSVVIPAARADTGSAESPLTPTGAVHDGGLAATLSDGRVLVLGGQDATGAATMDAELYDPSTGTWSEAAPPGVPLVGATITALANDRALVAGGERDTGPSASAAMYDAKANTWTTVAAMATPRADAVSAPIANGNVWVGGGFSQNGGPRVRSDEIYDVGSNSWIPNPDMPAATVGVAAGLSDGRVLVIGDPIAGSRQQGSEIYYPSAGAWRVGPNLPGAVSAVAAVPLPDGRIAAITNTNSQSASDLIYEPLANSFTLGSDLLGTGPGTFAASLPNGHVLLGGGFDTSVLSAEGTPIGGTGPINAHIADWLPPARANAQTLLDPTIEGPATVGGYLVVRTPALFAAGLTVQWQRCTSTCVDDGPPQVAPSTGVAYYDRLLTSDDLGTRLRVVMSLTTGGSTLSAASPLTAVVVPYSYSFHLSPGQPVPVSGGVANIQVDRTQPNAPSSIAYTVSFVTPGTEQPYTPISGVVQLDATAWNGQIQFPVTHDGVPLLATSVVVRIANPVDNVWHVPTTEPISGPTEETLSLAPAPEPAIPGNPLGLPVAPSARNPVGGARLFVDPMTIASRDARALQPKHPAEARLLRRIASQPSVTRFGAWNGPYPGVAVRTFLARADRTDPGTIPMLSTYRIVNGQCHRDDDTLTDAARYHQWITSFAEGIAAHPAVLFLEMDSLITTPCLSKQGLAIRLGELRDAIAVLSNCPHLVVYLDAGAADALRAARAAALLRQAGVASVQGFFLNSTHFDWTRKEIAYGQKISKLTGGKHFVINTAENGRGPLIPRHRAVHGNEVLCNPPGRGLGPLPTTSTHVPHLDAYAWIANPGVSGGPCRPGAPRTGAFWPALALELAGNANSRIS